MEDLDLLCKVLKIYAPSGREGDLAKFIIDYAQQYVDDVYCDKLGNVIVHKKGKGPKIVLSAHMDQLGLMVKSIDEQGYVRFSQLGSLKPFNLLDSRVCFANGLQGAVLADIREGFDKLTLDNLYIDLGIQDPDEVRQKIKPGDVAIMCAEPYLTQDMIISPCLDDRIGCYILLMCISQLAATVTDNDIYFVFTVQEEVGCKGAGTAIYSLMPDLFVTIDVTGSADELRKLKASVKLGDGVCIKVKDPYILITEPVLQHLCETAEEAHIPWQAEVCDIGGTDATPVQVLQTGVHSGALTLACRNIHSKNEIAALSDVKACRLLCQALLSKDLKTLTGDRYA